MKRLWQRYAERINGAKLRERVLVFAACALALVALLNLALIEPALTKDRRLSREIGQRQAEIGKIQEEIKKVALGRKAEPDKEVLGRLDAIKRRTLEVEEKVSREQRNLVPPEQVGALLEEMLSRNRKLLLVEMKTLPVVNLAQRSIEGAKPAAITQAPKAPAAAAPVAGGNVYRHGVEITLTGGYMDLLSYLKDLEKLPRQMYWGQLDLRVLEHPQLSLKLSVFTLSLDPAWLVV